MVTLPGLLPPLGLEISMSMVAVDVPLDIAPHGVLKLDFRGGRRMKVDRVITAGLGGVGLKVIGFEMEATHEKLGRVVMRQVDVDEGSLSTLAVTGDLPPTFRDAVMVGITLAAEKWPSNESPGVLTSKKPLNLACEPIGVYPPQGSVYKLQEPVQFVFKAAPSQVVATLMPFTATMSPGA